MKTQIKILAITMAICLSACKHLDKLGDENEADASLIRVADQLAAKQNNEMAARMYLKVLDQDPDNSYARIQLARLLKEEGYQDKAVLELNKVPPQDSRYQNAQEEIVRCYITAHKPDECKQAADKLLALEPNNSKYHNLKGVCLDIGGRHSLAQEQYKEALQLNPNYLGARSNLGLSLALSGQYEQGIELLNDAVKDPKSTARERQNLAVAYALKNDTKNAEKFFKADLDQSATENNIEYFREYNSKRKAK